MLEDDSLQTRETLLGRLRDLDDAASWRVFFDRYWRLIYNVALRAGLDVPSAQDIVQETVIAVARRMPGFEYNPERGSFKQWLLTITRRRISDHLRKTYRQPARADIRPEALDAIDPREQPAPEIVSDEIATVWEQEWERVVFEAAVDKVRHEVNPKHFQIFDYCVLKEWPVSKVATTLGLNSAQVYLVKHRVLQSVRRAVRRLTADAGNEIVL